MTRPNRRVARLAIGGDVSCAMVKGGWAALAVIRARASLLMAFVILDRDGMPLPHLNRKLIPVRSEAEAREFDRG
jgi:endonuclease YncB( thermonuclease family)